MSEERFRVVGQRLSREREGDFSPDSLTIEMGVVVGNVFVLSAHADGMTMFEAMDRKTCLEQSPNRDSPPNAFNEAHWRNSLPDIFGQVAS